ncbi:MAG: DUF255 domain-containing protein [Gammaproteobacteria bacterium]|nr:DUF255 domain-containing protein [Gammaproteobacteria bacterium]
MMMHANAKAAVMLGRFVWCVLVFVCGSRMALAEIATGKAAPNDLYQNASPYLALHGRDPVRWHLWNAKTVALAKAQNKLLFVSSGYFSCHWCHVMQRESYQNAEIAALLNKNFIPVKVDRELSAALDAKLVDFVERTQGYAGWPLNVFVTPEGYPLVGMVYVPPDNFKSILTQLQQRWQQDRAKLTALAKATSEELSKAEVTQSSELPAGLAAKFATRFVKASTEYEDDLQGGFGQQSKFPSVPQLQVLLTIYREHQEPEIKTFLQLTLDQMAQLGLWDQLGGGFFRYCVDPGWHVPHFEKMLYDNAQLAKLYFAAGEVFKRPDYTRVGQATLDFVLRELRTDSGAYAASLSAIDDHGEEGGYYLWSKQQIQDLLTAQEWEVARRVWQLDGPPGLPQGFHLQQRLSVQQVAEQLPMDAATVSKHFAAAKIKLFQARQARHAPKDDKKLAGWNGLLLSALVAGIQDTHDARYRQAAQALHDYLLQELWDGKMLARAKDQKGDTTAGGLEDYAYVIAGVLDWWRLTGNEKDRVWLQGMIEQAWQRFYGQQGWLLAQNMLLRYGAGSTLVSDGALPSAAGVLIASTYQFARATSNPALAKEALRALNVGHAEIEKEPFWHATQIAALLQVKK